VFARAGDLGRGQPEGQIDAVCVVGMHIADQLGLDEEARTDVYLTTLLFQGGCTAGVAELAAFIASDELAAQRDLCLCDPQNTVEIFGWMKRNVAVRAPLPTRMQRVLQMMFQGERMMANIEGGCVDVGTRIAQRLAMPPGTVSALRAICETWNGKGRQKLKGAAIPIAARIAQAAMVAGVFHNENGREAALGAVARRAGRALDPEIAAAFATRGRGGAMWEDLERAPAAAAVLALEPGAPRRLDDAGLDAIALALADFVDLKSARTAAHSRATADLAESMARGLGMPDDEIALCRRAALVHDLGQVGVPSAALDAPAASPAARAQLEMHPHFTLRLLASAPALRDIGAVAAAHHERLDGSGYPDGLPGGKLPRPARVLAVADEYDELVRGTQGRAPMASDDALAALGNASARFDAACVTALRDALLRPAASAARGPWPAGLTDREVDVVRLAAIGLTIKEIAANLSLSAHTARHHLEHVYEKVGVSSRAGVTLFAVEHNLVS
jgi:HD-GYP domain-containing protein (c-di-GMP phosphodiesterase class II)